MTDLVATKIDEIACSINDFRANYDGRLGELEKRFARGEHRGNGASRELSLGEMVTASDELKELTSSFRGKALIKLPGVELATITSGTGTVGATTDAGTSLVPAARVPGIVDPLTQQFFVRNLIPALPTISNVVEATVETGYTNNARPVTESTTKPTSDLTFNLKPFPVRTLAHMFQCSRQILDDAPGLSAYINKRGVYGLKQVEEQQMLTGNNVGQNLSGLIPQATAYDDSRSSTGDDEARILLHAISQAGEANAPITGIVISQKKWFDIMGIRDNQGRYLGEGPFGITAPRVWGLPTVPSNSMAENDFLVGSFGSGIGAQIYDRMGVEVLLSTENGTNFSDNEITVRIENRVSLVTLRGLLHPACSVGGQVLNSGPGRHSFSFIQVAMIGILKRYVEGAFGFLSVDCHDDGKRCSGATFRMKG
jgi:HK97 family phage major capsid protein